MLKPLPFELSKDEFHRLNRLRCDMRRRALEIVKLYFGQQSPTIGFEESDDADVDLYLILPGEVRAPIHIRATDGDAIVWHEILILSESLFFRMGMERMPIFYVVDVYKSHARIFHLVCGSDFDLVPEPRWRLRPRDGHGR